MVFIVLRKSDSYSDSYSDSDSACHEDPPPQRNGTVVDKWSVLQFYFFIRHLFFFFGELVIRSEVHEVDTVEHVMREVGTQDDALHLWVERHHLRDLAPHRTEQLCNSIRALSEHDTRLVLHVDQVGTTLVGGRKLAVVHDELMDLRLLRSKHVGQDLSLCLRRFELLLVVEHHLEDEAVAGSLWDRVGLVANTGHG